MIFFENRNEVVKFEVWWLDAFCFEVSSMCLYLTSFLFYSSIWWQHTKWMKSPFNNIFDRLKKSHFYIVKSTYTLIQLPISIVVLHYMLWEHKKYDTGGVGQVTSSWPLLPTIATCLSLPLLYVLSCTI